MLRRIPRKQIQLGMYIHAFDGSWFEHPFWRSRFLLESESDLQAVLDSKIKTLLIDTARGDDVPSTVATQGESAVTATVSHGPLSEPLPPARSRPAAPDGAQPEAHPHKDVCQVIRRSKEATIEIFDSARLGKAIESEVVSTVVEDIAATIMRNRRAFLEMVRLKSKDEYTYLHSVAVCALMVNLSRQLRLDKQTMQDMGTAGLLHDVGKMALPMDVLNKPGRLTDEEFTLMKTHPEQGFGLLNRSGGVLELALDVCLHHHEKMDGRGYPHGLRAGEISLAARMGAICDVYDAVTSDRPYKTAWSPMEAITRMRQWDGHFDPELLFAFMLSIDVLPIGLVVQMGGGRLAVVLESGRPAIQTKVLTFYSTRKRQFTRTELVISGGLGSRNAILAEVDPAAWDIPPERIEHLVRLGTSWT
jgi:HD-GYP domain-containing protein (c-di-GMP phosphodiesterase class II)